MVDSGVPLPSSQTFQYLNCDYFTLLLRCSESFHIYCNALDFFYISAARISEEEAREALLAFVAENCCYGKGAAEKMIMNLIVPSNALHVSHTKVCCSVYIFVNKQ